jgi:hypothetical protein
MPLVTRSEVTRSGTSSGDGSCSAHSRLIAECCSSEPPDAVAVAAVFLVEDRPQPLRGLQRGVVDDLSELEIRQLLRGQAGQRVAHLRLCRDRDTALGHRRRHECRGQAGHGGNHHPGPQRGDSLIHVPHASTCSLFWQYWARSANTRRSPELVPAGIDPFPSVSIEVARSTVIRWWRYVDDQTVTRRRADAPLLDTRVSDVAKLNLVP